jgi:hypothetical protein
MTSPRSTLRWAVLFIAAIVPSSAAPIRASAESSPAKVPASPTARCCMEMAQDRLGRLVLFGGFTPSYRYVGDTWTYDGVAWTRLAPTVAPTPRCCYAMTYDEAREEVVLFGGYSRGGYLKDTWTWDGTTWTRQTPVHSPPRDYEPVMAYDARRGVSVLFGDDGNDLKGDTWLWNGRDWRKQHPLRSPSTRPGAGMAFDQTRDRVVLFGGIDDSSCGDTGCADYRDTFTWDGANWVKEDPDQAPDKRSFMGMAPDPGTGKVALYGGVQDFLGGAIFGDTWKWDGTTWTEFRLDVRPPKRDGMAMAYSPALDRVVMFGGTSYGLVWYRDTWIWDGAAWSEG